MLNLLWLLCTIVLVLLNGFFVAAEFGMVKLRSTRVEVIKKTYGLRGKILARIHKNLDAYLSACQLGITLASLGLGWIGEPAFSGLLEPLFALLKMHSHEMARLISFGLSFLIISYMHIVIGELMPKSLAIRQAETVSIWTSVPLFAFYWLMYPIIWLFNASSNTLLHLTGLRSKHKSDNYYSTEEIKIILSASHLHGELTKDETKILEQTLEFADLKVTDIMRPIDEMTMLELQATIADNLQKVMAQRYSRYPVYDNQKKDIIGIVHTKDLFALLYNQPNIDDISALLRPVLKIPRYLPALKLLRKFREGMPHFALVYSDSENPIGFITLDNLLHVLVGRIKDEFHRTGDGWLTAKDGSLVMKGNSSIYTLERALNIDIEIPMQDGEEIATTIGGLILARLESLPQTGDRINFDEFDITIEKMKGPRIEKIRIHPHPQAKA